MATQVPAELEIIIDSRESRSDVPAWLARLGYATASAKLPIGDYAVGDRLMIERKTAADLVASIQDGRLFGQAELLASSDGFSCMILEGRLSELYSQIDAESVAGALSTLAVFYQISVLPAADAEATARLIGRLARHSTDGLGYEVALRANKPKTDGGRSQFLVEGLPGVGSETARRLLAHFGSAARVFAASSEELSQVRGIGPKAATAIIAALHKVPTSMRSTKSAPAR